jgi:uncharacterized damage-inducible protein DinB
MPIPATPADPGVTSTMAALFRQVHSQLRAELHDLDDEGLNWVPTSGANSIATILTHLVGSETETLRSVAGVECERDRDAEFVAHHTTKSEALNLLDRADSLLTDLVAAIDQSRLDGVFPLPTLSPEETRSGLTWLVGNYGHAREHVGHIQLTKQLYQRDRSSTP